MRNWGMILFTIRESVLKGTLIFYFVFGTGIILLFVFGLKVSPENHTVLFFGTSISERVLKGTSIVDFFLVQLYLASASAINLLGLIGTAGLLPAMMEKGSVELFLSKPISRPALLVSRCAGGILGVSLNICYFIFGIWLVFGLKLGVWHWGFFESAFFTSFVFACFFSIAVLAGVITQNTTYAFLFAFIFQIFQGILETREKGVFKLWDNVIFHRFLDGLYYITPQLSAMSNNTAHLIGNFPANPGTFTLSPFIYSFFSASFLYALSIYAFVKRDF